MKKYFLVLIFAFLCNLVQSIRFCVWADKLSEKVQERISTKNQQHFESNHKKQNIIGQQKMNKKKQLIEVPKNIIGKEKLFGKGQKLMSYHPHYLYSKSYPEPVTPHIYFGQINPSNQYVFLVKDNQTLHNQTFANEVFYVNSKKQQFTQNFKFLNLRSNVNIEPRYLNFAMVFQIQNALNIPVDAQIKVYKFNNFILLNARIFEGYFKSFLLYVVQNYTKIANISNIQTQDIKIQYKDISKFNNINNYRLAHESYIILNTEAIALASDKQPNKFNSFVVTVKYASLQALKRYKIAIRQFPIRDQQVQETLNIWTSQQDILQKAKLINITNFQYHLEHIPNQMIAPQSCENKAQKQLFQGLSYQYGNLSLKNGSVPFYDQPRELFSFSPSRKRFPWGFLWDDGFHCQVAVRSLNHSQTALKVIKSWLDTMTDFGWIPRQQNRGLQRQYLCSCPAFMTKDVRDGNPPTLLLALDFLASTNVLRSQNFEYKYWQKLQKWYNWFKKTQTIKQGSYIFKWYDSIANEGSFNSGMDDFPRLSNSLGHIDCQSWMYFFAKTMENIKSKLNCQGNNYTDEVKKIKQSLIQNFIQPNQNIPQDFSIQNGVKIFNNNFGYPSILPIAFGIINEEHKAFQSLILKIKQELDSNFGLTSISRKNSRYLQSQNAYWKGPVWININYLFLRGLKKYYSNQKDFYSKLRIDLIKTVCVQEQQRGYFYENYINGKGSFSYPFTGWTSLISIIVKQNY